MLTKLVLKDFQVHRRFVVPLAPVTTIVGGNDHGKSTIVRALRLVALNHVPRNAKFPRHGTERASAKLRVDGHVVERRRGKRDNTYVLDGRTFRAFGAQPPAEVAKVLDVDPISFQDQHDRALWFTLSPGEVSRALNKVVDLSVVDEVLGKIAAEAREARAEATAAGRRLTVARAEERGLRFAARADVDLRRAEALAASAVEARKRASGLRSTVVSLRGARTTLRGARTLLAGGTPAAVAGEAAANERGRARALEGAVRCARALRRGATVRLPDSTVVTSVERAAARATDARGRAVAMLRVVRAARSCSEEVERARRRAAKLDEELVRRFGRCPTCGGEVGG